MQHSFSVVRDGIYGSLSNSLVIKMFGIIQLIVPRTENRINRHHSAFLTTTSIRSCGASQQSKTHLGVAITLIKAVSIKINSLIGYKPPSVCNCLCKSLSLAVGCDANAEVERAWARASRPLPNFTISVKSPRLEAR